VQTSVTCSQTPFTGYVTATTSACILLYSVPGTVDYPWSSAISLSLTYNPSPVTTSFGTAVALLSGTGTRTFTNRFASSFVTSFSLVPSIPAALGPLLYLNSQLPFDSNGITLQLASPTQLPGGDPRNPVSLLNLYGLNSSIIELGSSLLDPLGQAFLSGIPGTINTTIGAANINTLAVNLGACKAPITFTNGLRSPTQPSVSNGGRTISWSYFISDGVSYSVLTNLTLTASSAFATTTDQLGNPYQSIIAITGTRAYTYLTTGAVLTSTVTSLANSTGDQRFYPYSLLSASPGVYSVSTTPFTDHDGLSFAVSPTVPALGLPNGAVPSYSVVTVYYGGGGPTLSPFLTEVNIATNPPLASLQIQTYSFQ